MMMRLLKTLFLVVVLVASGEAQASREDGKSRFAGMDDFLVHYKSWGSGTETVVLVHGFTLDQSFWRHQIPALSKGRRVIALDLPGHGESGRPREVAYGPALYGRAVAAVMADAGVKRATLVGHSMGLPVILSVLRSQPQLVKAAVFVDGAIVPAPGAPGRAEAEKQAAELAAAMRAPTYQVTLEQFASAFSGKASPALKSEILAKMRAIDPGVAASTFDNFTDPALWGPGKWSIPVLALYAKESSAGVKEWLGEHFPKAELKVWDDVDHFLQLEQPGRINRAIVDFLK